MSVSLCTSTRQFLASRLVHAAIGRCAVFFALPLAVGALRCAPPTLTPRASTSVMQNASEPSAGESTELDSPATSSLRPSRCSHEYRALVPHRYGESRVVRGLMRKHGIAESARFWLSG